MFVQLGASGTLPAEAQFRRAQVADDPQHVAETDQGGLYATTNALPPTTNRSYCCRT